MDKDIRKLPEPVKRRSRKNRDSVSCSNTQSSPPMTSTSNTSFDGQLSPSTLRNGESSATSAQEFVDPPSLQAFRKKHRKPFSEYPPAVVQEEPEMQRYWNEYDHPEDEDDGYYIYVDPNASVKFPGQETFEAWTKKTRKMFGMRLQAEERSLLSAVEDATTDDGESGSESPLGWNPRSNYGTMPQNSSAREGYFSSIFGGRVNPHVSVEALQERRSLLSELETRQRERETTKFRFYATCLAAAFAIDFILGLMTVTSRKKERGAVDAGVLFGAVCTLVLCVVAVISMKTRRDRLGWVHQGVVLSVVVALLGLDVLLLLWVLRI